MSNTPRLIITAEGLAVDAISAYGSSWNQTATMDRLASRSTVFHRAIVEEDDPLCVPRKIIDAVSASELAVTLVTDQPDLCAYADDLDELVNFKLPYDPSVAPMDRIEESHLGLLFAAFQEAIDRKADLPNQVIWLHTQSLHRVWDAPRELVPRDEWNLEREHTADLEGPLDFVEGYETEGQSDGMELDGLPWVFDSPEAPQSITIVDKTETFGSNECTREALGSWMRTYGCQVRLLDLMMGIAITEDMLGSILLMGTTGYALGQAGVIGHQMGLVTTSQIQVPCLLMKNGGTRRELGIQSAGDLISSFVLDSEIEKTDRIITESERAQRIVVTQGWTAFWDEPGSDPRLFLQPQDQHNANDVSKLRWDIVEELSE